MDCSEDEIAQAAIIVAYYQLMTGQPESSCLDTLRAALPSKFTPVTAGIVADIAKQANSYAPLTVKTYPIGGGKGTAAVQVETASTALPTTPPSGLPKKIGTMSLVDVMNRSKQTMADYAPFANTPKTPASVKKMQQALQPLLYKLQEIVVTYAKNNGYDVILERDAFDDYRKSGSITKEKLAYCDEIVAPGFIARLNGSDGRRYAAQLNAVNIDDAISRLFP